MIVPVLLQGGLTKIENGGIISHKELTEGKNMKKLISVLLICVLLAGGFWIYSRLNRTELPARGVWAERTYTNKEANIQLTVPEEYDIGTDEKIIDTYGFSEDYFEDVKNKHNCLDVFVQDTTSGSYSRMYIEYYLGQDKKIDAEQTLEFYKARNTKYTYYLDGSPDLNRIYGENFELTLCGQTYICCSFTLEGIEEFYQIVCYRITSTNATVLIDIRGKSEERVNAYLTFFDTASVK